MSVTPMPETTNTAPKRRFFMHGTMKLSDPGANMTPEQARAHYATSYPDLANATVSLKETKDNVEIWEFKRAVGTKG